MTIDSPLVPHSGISGQRPVFAGTDVCRQAGLFLPEGAHRLAFDDDVWDFTHVNGLPVQMSLACRRFDFAAITDPRWRLVAKELIFAMLVPRHEAVALLPRAYRTALHLSTAGGRLIELTRFLHWLAERDIARLEDIDTDCCEEYLARRRYVRDGDDAVIGELSPATRRSAAQASSISLTTGSCSPPIVSPPAFGHGAAPPPRPSRSCPAAEPSTRPRRWRAACSSRCWPRPSTCCPPSGRTLSS